MANADNALLFRAPHVSHRSADAGDHGMLSFVESGYEGGAPGFVGKQHWQSASFYAGHVFLVRTPHGGARGTCGRAKADRGFFPDY
jgi:hypothetical protein